MIELNKVLYGIVGEQRKATDEDKGLLGALINDNGDSPYVASMLNKYFAFLRQKILLTHHDINVLSHLEFTSCII